jgi:hypothetical protein
MQMFQVLAGEFLGCGDGVRLTYCDPVVIVAIGASRIYRGLVDHPAFSQSEAQAAAKCWGKVPAANVKDSDIV